MMPCCLSLLRHSYYFRQPLVPVMNIETGEWLLSDPLQPMTKPGGHGAIWKLMRDEGIFDWLKEKVSRIR